MNDKEFMAYKIEVEPAMQGALAAMEEDAASFGITTDMFNRAIYRFIMERLMSGPTPQWYFDELDEIDRELKEKRNNGE